MIDVERLEQQLDHALTDELKGALGLVSVPARSVSPSSTNAEPASRRRATSPRRVLAAQALHPSRTPRTSTRTTVPTRDIAGFVRAGQLAEAARLIGTEPEAEAASWKTMQALLEGRIADAVSLNDAARSLGHHFAAPDEADDRFWAVRFWIVLDWGDEDAHHEMLDECRERAYMRNDVYWRSLLALLCAHMGRTDEAVRESDSAAAPLDLGRHGLNGEALIIAANLVEAAMVAGDPARARILERSVPPAHVTIFDDRARVFRGAAARYQALVAAAAWKWDECDRLFQSAVDAHRSAGALPLLARTLHEWGMSLTARSDVRAWDHLRESSDLARRLSMTGAVTGQPVPKH